jgi:hypothetical protein
MQLWAINRDSAAGTLVRLTPKTAKSAIAAMMTTAKPIRTARKVNRSMYGMP